MSPRPTPAPCHMPSPPDFYGMLWHAVKQDAHQVILAVLQCPLFAQATFTNQADFPLLADQKGLYDTLSATLVILDHKAAADSAAVNSFFVFTNAIIKTENNHHELQHQCEAAAKQCHECKDHNIKMLASHLDLLAHCFDTLNLYLSSPQSKLDGKSKPKKVKITPLSVCLSHPFFLSGSFILLIALANYKPGSKTTLLLLGQIDALLEAHPVINSHSSAPLEDLKKQCDVVELVAEQQLHLLDTTLQTYKLIVAHLSCLDKALFPIDVDLASSLLTALNVSFESAPKDSDVKPANSLVAKPQNPLEPPSTSAL
ncbi:hypothetical protein E4T56_gene20178 [Termitomyces sp. T112]|nr:hypothetical protein E4T56_gene20178 [Termitomyces sp. T112]